MTACADCWAIARRNKLPIPPSVALCDDCRLARRAKIMAVVTILGFLVVWGLKLRGIL